MEFCVIKWKGLKQIEDTVYLEEDTWNDFGYQVTYNVYYRDKNKKLHTIGRLKVGNTATSDGEKRLDIGQMKSLEESFFSLGSSEEYYDKIKSFGSEIRENILKSLRDIAFNREIFDKVKNMNVTKVALLRDVNISTVENQYRRIAQGGAKQTEYNFEYESAIDSKSLTGPYKLEFSVVPGANPPTNIHVIIGRNGVGKTHFIKNITNSVNDFSGNSGVIKIPDPNNEENKQIEKVFTNVIRIAFSAFDHFDNQEEEKIIPIINVGLPSDSGELSQSLTSEFVTSIEGCLKRDKENIWETTVRTLESDPMFKESNIRKILSFKGDQSEFLKESRKIFERLSSGHKIILLTITKLVENVEEKSLVILDEPENHLHPPLLSSFMRALSELMIYKNAVALIATHSPVVIQEVPKKCVWKLTRHGREVVSSRLEQETFGENLGVLTREVFGYEVNKSGFYKMLEEKAIELQDYDKILKVFQNELGDEAKAILRSILARKWSDLSEEN